MTYCILKRESHGLGLDTIPRPFKRVETQKEVVETLTAWFKEHAVVKGPAKSWIGLDHIDTDVAVMTSWQVKGHNNPTTSFYVFTEEN